MPKAKLDRKGRQTEIFLLSSSLHIFAIKEKFQVAPPQHSPFSPRTGESSSLLQNRTNVPF
jgi:hypothetical protein